MPKRDRGPRLHRRGKDEEGEDMYGWTEEVGFSKILIHYKKQKLRTKSDRHATERMTNSSNFNDP